MVRARLGRVSAKVLIFAMLAAGVPADAVARGALDVASVELLGAQAPKSGAVMVEDTSVRVIRAMIAFTRELMATEAQKRADLDKRLRSSNGRPEQSLAEEYRRLVEQQSETKRKMKMLCAQLALADRSVNADECSGAASQGANDFSPLNAQVKGAYVIGALNDQVEQLYDQGKYNEALPLAQSTLARAERELGKEHRQTLRSMNDLGILYKNLGRYEEAEPLLKRALETNERLFGAEDPGTLAAQNNLAGIYSAQGRLAEAEKLLGRALEASERARGKDDPGTLAIVNSLAAVYQQRGRYKEAEPLLNRALEAYERLFGPDHADTLLSLNNLGYLYQVIGRYREAELLFKRAIEASERVLPKDHPQTLISKNNLAALYQAQGRHREADPLFKYVQEAHERTLGPEHPQTLLSVNNLGLLYEEQGRYGDSEPLFKRALEACERVLPRDHPDTLQSVSNLASHYQHQGRYQEAEPLFKRSLEGHERMLGKEHPGTLAVVSNFAVFYQIQGRYGEAAPLLERALEGLARALPKDHPDTLKSGNNVAELFQALGRYKEAETMLNRMVEASERVLGADHPDTLRSLHNLAGLYEIQGRYGEAGPLYKFVLDASEQVLGEEHPTTIASRTNLGLVYYAQRDWVRAAKVWRRSAASIARRDQRGAGASSQALTGKKKSETEPLSSVFWGLTKAVYRIASQGSAPDAGPSREMFETAQWAQSSEAAASLAQMAARGAAVDAKLSARVRERQDLTAEWKKREELWTEWLGKSPDQRDAKAEKENKERLDAIDARIGQIDGILEEKFPDYAGLASPAPLTAAEAQSQLGGDEALILFLDTPDFKSTPEETFIWVLTKTDMRWVRSDLGTKALAREVQALRCGLDVEAWADRPCAELTGQSYTDADREVGNPLPFDHARAYRLYQALFGQAEDLIRGKELLIVPSGALTQLPFQVLVTAAPASADQKSAAWLIRDHALTVLPAVSSLKALRRVARPGAANKPMMGFGNPLLDGEQNNPKFGAYYKKLAQRARDKQRCPETAWQRVAALVGLRRGVTPVQTRGGLADVDFLRMQAPLPETADELCAVARDVHADLSEIRLGERATEREVKRLSKTGQLAQYRIVHFATHGALAGQVQGNAEPGLLLTPPAMATEEDDGYLTASEIAGLKLEADWVILSACNTAAGGAQGAEALSGLARAFIYAQARALLVSHWEVDSDATVTLITGAMSRLSANKAMGRAEAMRQSMLALIDKGEPREAHPAFWAPFVLVGEGGAGR